MCIGTIDVPSRKKMKTLCAALTIIILLAAPLVAQGVGVGTRIDFTAKLNLNNGTSGQFAQLFIPDFFVAPADGNLLLVVHLHSASWAAEDEVYRSHVNAVLFNIHLGGFSSSYQTYFATQSNFQKILDSVVAVLQSRGIVNTPRISKLIVTSFSAGYAGMREIFKTAAYYNRINALTLADGLHCNSDSATMRTQMQDFVRFARDARDRRKVFLLTHSSITTSGYENTTQTATYLINNVGATRRTFAATDSIGTQYSRSDTGHFLLKGYFGTTATDHLKHLYNMHVMLGQAASLLDSIATTVDERDVAPEGFWLDQNFPNPFNAMTHFGFRIGAFGLVSLKVYDLLGEEVATLFDEYVPSGNYQTRWDASAFSSGTYFYRLEADHFTATRKLQLLK
jgi:hypothetical protein